MWADTLSINIISNHERISINMKYLTIVDLELIDLIAASRIHEDIGNNPELFTQSSKRQADDLDDDIPFYSGTER
jgi:hypothetical protein